MSPHARRHLTLAGLVSGATLVIGSLGILANGVVSLDRRVGVGATVQDSLFRNDSLFDARLARLERIERIKPRAPISSAPDRSEGLARRIFHLLF